MLIQYLWKLDLEITNDMFLLMIVPFMFDFCGPNGVVLFCLG